MHSLPLTKPCSLGLPTVTFGLRLLNLILWQLIVDLFITQQWDRYRHVEVVALWVCHGVMVWDTCLDMFLDRKQTPPVLHCDWSVWWHATHSSTYPKVLWVDPHHLVCLWSGHHVINHIPETPFQTFQGLWINRKWPSIISQRLHSKHSKGTPFHCTTCVHISYTACPCLL